MPFFKGHGKQVLKISVSDLTFLIDQDLSAIHRTSITLNQSFTTNVYVI